MHSASELAHSEPNFPWLAMMALCVGMLAHSVVFTAPLPFVAFMVVDFKMSESVDTAGYYAGWITGAFMLGRTVASIGWGLASDRFGRRVCLLVTMFNVSLLGLLLGFSKSFAMAVILRLAIGLGNGFMAIAKTCVSEICTKEQEMRGFGMLNGIWGLGLIVGPSIGGLLSRPSIQYPKLFHRDGLWGRYPYLLPCIMSSCVAVVAFFFIFLFLPETAGVGTMKNQALVPESTDIVAAAHDKAGGAPCSSGSSIEMMHIHISSSLHTCDLEEASYKGTGTEAEANVKVVVESKTRSISGKSASIVTAEPPPSDNQKNAVVPPSPTTAINGFGLKRLVESINNGFKTLRSSSSPSSQSQRSHSRVRFQRVSGSDNDTDNDADKAVLDEEQGGRGRGGGNENEGYTTNARGEPSTNDDTPRSSSINHTRLEQSSSDSSSTSNRRGGLWPILIWWPPASAAASYAKVASSVNGEDALPEQTSRSGATATTDSSASEDKAVSTTHLSDRGGDKAAEEGEEQYVTGGGSESNSHQHTDHGIRTRYRYFSIRNLPSLLFSNWSEKSTTTDAVGPGQQSYNQVPTAAVTAISTGRSSNKNGRLTDIDNNGIVDDGNDDKNHTLNKISVVNHHVKDRNQAASTVSTAALGGGDNHCGGHYKKPTTLTEMIKEPHIIFICIIYMGFSFSVMFIDEVFPLWCVSSIRRGGLSWSSAQVGSTLASCGLALVIYQFFFYEPCVKRCCPAKPAETFFRLASVSSVSVATFPYTVYADMQAATTAAASPAHKNGFKDWLPFWIIVVALATYRSAANAAFSTLSMVVNSSVDRELRGTLNGLIMTCGSMGNALGPILGASLYAAAVALPDSSGIDGRIAFIFASVFIIILATATKCCLRAIH